MTEKRFEIDDDDEYFIDNKTGKSYDACGGGDGLPFIIDKYDKLEKECLDLSEELDYYKTKCASLETGLFQADKEIEQLKANYNSLSHNNGLLYDECNNEINSLKKENDSLKLLVQNWEALDDEKDEQINRQSQVLKKLKKENEEFKGKLNSISGIIDEQIWQVNHTHENCKKVGIAELKKLKKVLICNSIIQDGDLGD